MSTQAPAQLDPHAAYNVVHSRVYAPVFFQKLAQDYNIRPQGPEEAGRMLRMAETLRLAHDQSAAKQASQLSLLDAAEQQLHGSLKQAGFQSPEPIEPVIKQAASSLAADPELAHAMLTLMSAPPQG